MAPRHLANKLPSIRSIFPTGEFVVTSVCCKDSERAREKHISNFAGHKKKTWFSRLLLVQKPAAIKPYVTRTLPSWSYEKAAWKFSGQGVEDGGRVPALNPPAGHAVVLFWKWRSRGGRGAWIQKPTLGSDLLESIPSGAEAEVISVELQSSDTLGRSLYLVLSLSISLSPSRAWFSLVQLASDSSCVLTACDAAGIR